MSQQTHTDVIRLLQDLVTVDSTNPGGDEHAAAQVLAAELEQHGVACEIDRYQANHANLVAVVEFGPGPTVMLNSHLDVVPAVGEWSSPPFVPRVHDGLLFGRGAADAKGSLAPMAVAMLRLIDDRKHLRGRVVFTAVGDEEVGSTGARHLLTAWRPDAAIVGEPTDLKLLTAHKGSVRPVVEVHGIAAHAAAPANGVNAIEGLSPLLTMLKRHAESLLSREHRLTGSPTMTPVLVQGGEAPNAVAAACRLTLDRRLIPGETADQALGEIEQLLLRFDKENAPLTARVVECAPSTGGPSETPSDATFVVACQRALAELGTDATLGGLLVNCDMTHFRAVGVPTVVIGPGRLEAMHVPDEHIEIDQVRRAVDVYEATLRHALAAL